MATRRKPAAERRDPQALEERRLRAAELFAQDVHQAKVARTLGVSRQAVSRWHAHWQADGSAGLASRGAPGRTPGCPTPSLNRQSRRCWRAPRPTASPPT